MRDLEVVRAVEALLFVAEEAVKPATLQRMFPVELDTAGKVLRVIDRVKDLFDEKSAMHVSGNATDGWALSLDDDMAVFADIGLSGPGKRHKMPVLCMKALIFTAYHQPITVAEARELSKSAIEYKHMDILLEEGLVQVVGQREGSNRPALFATTPAFLAMFGLKSIQALPGVDELKLILGDDAFGEELSIEEEEDVNTIERPAMTFSKIDPFQPAAKERLAATEDDVETLVTNLSDINRRVSQLLDG